MMRILVLAAGYLIYNAGLGVAAPDLDLEHRYLEVYLGINDAEHLEQKRDLAGALKDFKACYAKLLALHTDNPDWETSLVEHRVSDCRIKIIDLQTQIGDSSPIPDPINHARASYPWKTNLGADLFWIGKGGVKQSAWDTDWVKSNGGVDPPDERNGYSASAHVDQLNPFYVALPFNDLAHSDAARKWIPASWARQPKNGKAVSACKDRWVEIKNANGRVCYAQWEDAGPSGDADPEYVFGAAAPKSGDKPALSVSPAVAEYLGYGGVDDRPAHDKPDIVSWRFVDEADVAPGQWLKYEEQGLIYAAMNK